MLVWRYIAAKAWWAAVEPGDADDAVPQLVVTDEFIMRVADPNAAAQRISAQVGSIPPPLEARVKEQNAGNL